MNVRDESILRHMLSWCVQVAEALARMAKVLMGSLNLTAVTQDMLYDIPIALFSWHKS